MINPRDIATARNMLRKVSHRPIQEQDAILREWFGRKATAAFIAAVREAAQ